MQLKFRHLFLPTIFLIISALAADAQNFSKELSVPEGGTVSVTNRYGRVDIEAVPVDKDSKDRKGRFTASSERKQVTPKEISITTKGSRTEIEVRPVDPGKRIDVSLKLPERSSVSVETLDGAVMVTGDLTVIEAKTDTGTVAVDIPTNRLDYDLEWTEAHPRIVSDITLEKIKERSRGRFTIKGSTYDAKALKKAADDAPAETTDPPDTADADIDKPEDTKKKKKKRKISEGIDLRFSSSRGIFLLNVPPNEVSSDLRERPLTKAAKAIIRSGDTYLMDAIRRSSPKYFGDYLKTLPPIRREPVLTTRDNGLTIPAGQVKRALVRVIDGGNRTVAGLEAKDFEVSEGSVDQEVVAVQPVTAPVNLVLLLDVSGSVENYVNFIRKAARSFVNTVDRRDKISIVMFNDDVKVLSGFTTDRSSLSKSLDTFDAGGGTAYYDALAYTLADTLRPLKGDRTAIVVLTDGDDNRSFLAFDSLAGSIQESGALIYPLYVPSGLIAASATSDPNMSVDPLRTKYMGLTTKAAVEGERLANISGGTYYPISQLAQIQAAYDDIVQQLRTAYYITYRAAADTTANTTRARRLRIRAKRDGTTVNITSVTAIQ
ncbi:MAG: VWA domain-containing protein [Acidobacteriota bacterium]